MNFLTDYDSDTKMMKTTKKDPIHDFFPFLFGLGYSGSAAFDVRVAGVMASACEGDVRGGNTD